MKGHPQIKPGNLVLVAIAVLLMGAWWQTDQWYGRKLSADQRAVASDLLEDRSNALTAAINRRLSIVDALAAFVRTHPDQKEMEKEFIPFAEGIFLNGSIRYIGILPGGVGKFVYPPNANRYFQNRNLQIDRRPENQDDIRRAIRTHKTTLSGPYAFEKGRLELAAGKAVFIHKRFWGFVIAVVDLRPMLDSSGLTAVENDLAFSLGDNRGRIFFANSKSKRAIDVDSVELPEGSWKLSAVPTALWDRTFAKKRTDFRGFMSLMAGILFYLAYLIVTYQERLREAVEDRTRNLLEAKKALEEDIRARERAERSLIESEARYRSLIEQASDGIFIVDGSIGSYIDVNGTACEMTGYSRDELLTMSLADLIPEEDQATHPLQLDQFELRGTHWFERRIRRKDGRIILVEATAKRVGEHRILAIVRDITERRRIEETMNRFFDSTPMGKVIVDRNFQFVRVNQEIARDFGITSEQFAGKKVDSLFANIGGELIAIYERIFAADANVGDIEFRIERPDQVRYFNTIHFPILGPDDRPEYVGSFFVDITQRKNSENALKEFAEELEQRITERTARLEEANKELESFSYSVSHDLRAPLRGISGFSQALLEEYETRLDETGRDYLRRIHQAGLRMGQLIDDLLKLSRLSRSEMVLRNVDLSGIVEGIAAELRESQPERAVEFVIEPEVGAFADERLVRIALDNLLRNAWKFTCKKEKARIEFGRTVLAGETTYFVRDNGAGFDMAFADRLFIPFQRLHADSEFEGMGIGLATVQRIVRRHGGRVWAEGRVGRGAVFSFSLN